MHGIDLLEAAGIGWDIFEPDSWDSNVTFPSSSGQSLSDRHAGGAEEKARAGEAREQ
jgi:hypothetical protein